MTNQEICDRWVEKLGLGFHPDTRGANYDPPLSAKDAARYDLDMDRLWLRGADVYAEALAAMARAGLIKQGE